MPPYVEKNLLPGEKIVYQGKMHWIVFAVPAAVSALGITDKGLVLFLMIGVAWGIIRLIEYLSTEMVLTDQRIVFKTGLFSVSTTEALLTKAEGIRIHQSFVGNLLNFGTVSVAGTGGIVRHFKNVASPGSLRSAFAHEVERVQAT